ncbi:MAG: hypothetical protein HY287_05035 [Planctomycetes bacterium]|nr:hypothetical protein [Planctomycetota bacterium]MBI3833679.1 hypothetical protein [Planctomycetota bacterium]
MRNCRKSLFKKHAIEALLFAVMLLSNAASTSRAEETAPTKGELAIKGYCPVSYYSAHKPVKGKPELHSEYQGFTYYFAGTEEKKAFDAAPQDFAPQFASYCTTALGGPYGNRIPCDPEVFDVRDKKLYLFSSARAKKSYDIKQDEYIKTARGLFEKPALKGHCPVSYQLHSEARKGDAKYAAQYGEALYWFADEAALQAFKKEPERYAPPFLGLCAAGIAENKHFAADPTVFHVVDNRTYLFFDTAARDRFKEKSAEMIKSAQANWPEIRHKLPTIQP